MGLRDFFGRLFGLKPEKKASEKEVEEEVEELVEKPREKKTVVRGEHVKHRPGLEPGFGHREFVLHAGKVRKRVVRRRQKKKRVKHLVSRLVVERLAGKTGKREARGKLVSGAVKSVKKAFEKPVVRKPIIGKPVIKKPVIEKPSAAPSGFKPSGLPGTSEILRRLSGLLGGKRARKVDHALVLAELSDEQVLGLLEKILSLIESRTPEARAGLSSEKLSSELGVPKEQVEAVISKSVSEAGLRLPKGSVVLVEGPVESDKEKFCRNVLEEKLNSGQKVGYSGFDARDVSVFDKKFKSKIVFVKTEEDLNGASIALSDLISEKPAAVIVNVLSRLAAVHPSTAVSKFAALNVKKFRDSKTTSLFIVDTSVVPNIVLSELESLFDGVVSFQVEEENGKLVSYYRVKRFQGADVSTELHRFSREPAAPGVGKPAQASVGKPVPAGVKPGGPMPAVSSKELGKLGASGSAGATGTSGSAGVTGTSGAAGAAAASETAGAPSIGGVSVDRLMPAFGVRPTFRGALLTGKPLQGVLKPGVSAAGRQLEGAPKVSLELKLRNVQQVVKLVYDRDRVSVKEVGEELGLSGDLVKAIGERLEKMGLVDLIFTSDDLFIVAKELSRADVREKLRLIAAWKGSLEEAFVALKQRAKAAQRQLPALEEKLVVVERQLDVALGQAEESLHEIQELVAKPVELRADSGKRLRLEQAERSFNKAKRDVDVLLSGLKSARDNLKLLDAERSGLDDDYSLIVKSVGDLRHELSLMEQQALKVGEKPEETRKYYDFLVKAEAEAERVNSARKDYAEKIDWLNKKAELILSETV